MFFFSDWDWNGCRRTECSIQLDCQNIRHTAECINITMHETPMTISTIFLTCVAFIKTMSTINTNLSRSVVHQILVNTYRWPLTLLPYISHHSYTQWNYTEPHSDHIDHHGNQMNKYRWRSIQWPGRCSHGNRELGHKDWFLIGSGHQWILNRNTM